MTGALPIYVINLDHSANRLAYQRRQFERMGMQFERVQAIDGLALSREDFEKYAFLGDRPISHSEVACFLSHRLCWKKAAEGSGAVIMEDDQVLADEIKPLLGALRPREGALIFNLETQPRPRYVSREAAETIGGVRFFELMMPTAGAGAYVVTREAAKILLDRADRRATIADYFIHSAPGIRRLQADPGMTLELRTLSGMFKKIRRPEAETVITRSTHGRNLAIRLYWTVKYPMTRVRRGLNQLKLSVKKAWVPLVSVRRKVEPSPSIIANFETMDALDHPKGTAHA
jgi:glycosyl transferase family 25